MAGYRSTHGNAVFADIPHELVRVQQIHQLAMRDAAVAALQRVLHHDLSVGGHVVLDAPVFLHAGVADVHPGCLPGQRAPPVRQRCSVLVAVDEYEALPGADLQ
jgi:hypothetical protein